MTTTVQLASKIEEEKRSFDNQADLLSLKTHEKQERVDHAVTRAKMQGLRSVVDAAEYSSGRELARSRSQGRMRPT